MLRSSWFIGALLAVAPIAAPQAQGASGTVRGRVTEQGSGTPVSGVTVTVGARATQTRQNGEYLLTIPAGSDSIRFRLIGYAPASRAVTVAAGQTATVDIALSTQAIGLAAVVVTGYGEQRAADITGAVTQVTTEKFNTGRVVSPELLIQNKVAGVQVVDNNEPGGGLSLRIRGPTSVNASSDPLIVVDGVPLGTGSGGGLSAGRNPLNFLNPNDIESITVLRDASAAAIYGANAANGVVLITTKSGGTGGPSFEYNGSTSASVVDRLPQMLDAAQFRTAVQQFAPQNVNQLANSNTDWFDIVGRTAYGQEHNVSVTGSGNDMRWRISGGFLRQDGIIQGTSAERASLGLNFQQLLFDDRLDVRVIQLGSRALDRFTPGGVLSNAAQMGPTQPVTDPEAQTGYYNWPGNTLQSPDNPVEILDLARDRGITYRSVGSIQSAYRTPFLDNLRAHVSLNYDITRTDRTTFTPSQLHGQQKSGQNGADYRANQSQSNTGFETFLTYAAPTPYIPGNIDVTGGYSYNWSHAEYPWYLATGLSTDLLGGNGVAPARTVQNEQNIQESKLISFFGRLNYNIDDRYLLGASVRRDGSSRFGPSNAWGVFPAFSAGWRISQEPFMRSFRNISELKLRASWAKTGNQAFANYQYFATYQLSDAQTQAQFGNEFISTLRPGAYDPRIKWEETRSIDVGLDFGLMGERVTGSLDWYTKETDNLIFNVPVAAGTNLSNFLTTNIGSMRNRGVELALSAGVLRGGTGRLNWTADFTAAHNTNELVAINPIFGDSAAKQQILTGLVSGGVGTFIQLLRPGQPINSFFVYEHKRTNGKPVFAKGEGADLAMYVDQNNDGRINQDDRVPFKDPAPKWMLGHSSYFDYRNFDLSFALRAYLGNHVYNNVASNLGTYEEVKRASPYNLHASVLETGFETPQYLSDYYVEDASFLRMDNITLGYSFDMRGQPMRVFGTVQNAFTLTDYSGVDPTAGLNGLDNNIYPRARTFTAGLRVRF